MSDKTKTALTGVGVSVLLVVLQAVAQALVDGSIEVPPAWAWLASTLAGLINMAVRALPKK